MELRYPPNGQEATLHIRQAVTPQLATELIDVIKDGASRRAGIVHFAPTGINLVGTIGIGKAARPLPLCAIQEGCRALGPMRLDDAANPQVVRTDGAFVSGEFYDGAGLRRA